MIWARSYTGIVLFIRYLSNVLYVYFFNEWHEIMRLKSKLYCNVMTSPEFTFHNPCVILGLVRSTVILWRDFRCWHKSCSNKATLLLAWRYRYWNSMDVIMNWLTAPKRPFPKWEWVFYVYFSFLDHRQDLYQIWQWIPQRMPYKKQAVLTL